MNRLAIDTSSPLASVAVETEDGKVVIKEAPSKDSHSKKLASLVDAAREVAGLGSIAEIGEIIVGLGPGSFTGLRIGLSFAKGVSWARKIPLFGADSFPAIADAYWTDADSVAVVSDARRGEFFFSCYHRRGQEVLTDFELKICTRIEIDDYLSRFSPESRVLMIDAGVGEGETFSIPTCKAHAIAGGLLRSSLVTAHWDLPRLSVLEPRYLRAVSALTIAERQASTQK